MFAVSTPLLNAHLYFLNSKTPIFSSMGIIIISLPDSSGANPPLLSSMYKRLLIIYDGWMGNRGKDSDLGINRKKEFLIHNTNSTLSSGTSFPM